MDSINFSTISGAIGIVMPILVFLGCIWIVLRTQSRHVLIYRLWRLVHGSQDISDPEVSTFINEQTSLMSFRFMSGVPVKSLESARQLIQWTKIHDMEMRELAFCGEYFDADLRQIRKHKLPSVLLQKTRFSFAMVVLLASLSCLFAVQFDDAILKMKATDHWFLMRQGEARVLFPIDASPIRKVDCSTGAPADAARTSFNTAEVKILCDVLNSDDASAYIDKALKAQKWVAAMLFVTLLIWVIGLLLGWKKGSAALQLARRSLDPVLPNTQVALDFNSTAIPSRSRQ